MTEKEKIDEIKLRIKSALTESDEMTDICYALVEYAKDITRGDNISQEFFSDMIAEVETFYLED